MTAAATARFSRSKRRLAWLLAAVLVLPQAQAQDTLRLRNDTVELQLAPQLGGRAVHLALHGRANVLKVGTAVREQPAPRLAADAGNIAYLGHEIWLGPQSAWWRDQDANPARRDVQADWPPDPWLAFGRNRVLQHDPHDVQLQGPASPVSGVQVTQRYTLSAQRPGTVEVSVEARNVRGTPVARDIWFNTRVAPTTRVYVPAVPGDVRVRSDTDADYAELRAVHSDGLFSLALDALPAGKQGRRGKVFIQPGAGWMAGFAADQLFVIRFEQQPRERIHPEHGQVELYLEWRADDASAGLLEMEVHAPYRHLAAGERMNAREWWTLLAYNGPDERAAQVAFLRRHAVALGIEMPE
ncbi:DUF4380 domain-containing protein [Lysobacter cavernae]|uniref:DUF4380 domain-containing protein n=1 Tax=Lysobacter cavernae TaxID=1685901 RepID=A0ABV7RRD6_9GAMM